MTTSRRAIDLSGHWFGIYDYGPGQPQVGFEAELLDLGGKLSGETSEVADGYDRNAKLVGGRSGSRVVFNKRYIASPDLRYAASVNYDGTLREGGEEVSGRWSIPDRIAGSFIMFRRPPMDAEEDQDVRVEASSDNR